MLDERLPIKPEQSFILSHPARRAARQNEPFEIMQHATRRRYHAPCASGKMKNRKQRVKKEKGG
jgi:hypothetical protein